ncbi:hypothetical protein [Kribbella sp. CA-293567]|nr:hypothetical protein [Kribbella sp. CA-293567]WBQ04337.1 hypothetical protein OX958_30765 [Kribbella sp. CA-293567]
MTGSVQAINIVFDGPAAHEAGRFVEVEIDDGLWALRIENGRLRPEED